MSNPLPENEGPVNLRVSKALSVRREQTRAPGTVAAGQLGPEAASEAQVESGAEAELLTMPALAAAGAATVVLGTGWLLRRRLRLARRPRHPAEAVPSQPLAPLAPVPAPSDEATAAREAEVIADLASQFEDEPESLQPQQTFPAQLEHQYRPPSRIGIASQKRLIKTLMWLRTAAGAAALLAAIAIVVFWAIELIDRRSGDTGLTRPLLVVLAVAWAGSWGAGWLANQLHRAFFGRVHPKFDN